MVPAGFGWGDFESATADASWCSFPRAKPAIRERRLYLEHLNPHSRVIDFGPVRTDGSVLIEREGSQWSMRTYPRDRAFTLLLDASRFGQPS